MADELNLNLENFPLERYDPLDLLGRGGLGEVYLARDKKLGRTVAVKCLMAVDDEQITIFHREAKIASKLHHPNIVGTLDFGTTEGGRPYIAFEYFKGISLEKLIAERGGRLDEKLVRKLFVVVARALSYIHEHKVFHRDLKPSNILIRLEDTAIVDTRIIDFGVSAIKEDIHNKTLVQGKTIVGTPVYMSPDPVRGEDFDARSEVYSLGCIMFECLTGEPPFDAPSTAEVLELHMFSEAPLMGEIIPDVKVTPEMQRIIDKCLSKDKDARYQTMTALADALAQPAASASSEAQPATPPVVQRLSGRSLFAVAIGVIVLLIAGAAVTMFILKGFASREDAFNVSNDSKELSGKKSAGVSPKVDDDVTAQDRNSSGVYLSGSKGIKRLKALAAAKFKTGTVTLNGQPLAGDVMENLAVLQPKVVQIYNSDISDHEVFAKLPLISSMKELDFHQCSGLTPEDLAWTKGLPRLSSVLLVGCEITDKHIIALSAIKGLNKLVLDGNKDISMEGLKSLSGKDQLVQVWVNEGSLTKLTREELKRLRAKDNILLITRLPRHEGDGGDGMIHTDALELIE